MVDVGSDRPRIGPRRWVRPLDGLPSPRAFLFLRSLRLVLVTFVLLQPPIAGFLPALADPRCPQELVGPHRLGPVPVGPALGVVHCDGRPAHWDPLTVLGHQLYWRAEDACRAFDAELWWDPADLRGEWQIDSVRCSFIVGGEVIHCDTLAWQMRAPVLYAENRLWFPLDLAEVMAEKVLPGRYQYDSLDRILRQRPVLPPADIPVIEQLGRRTYLRWRLERAPVTRLFGDGVASIIVEIDSVGFDPLTRPEVLSRRGACLREIRPYEGGTAYCLTLSDQIRAWRFRWRAAARELELTLSENAGDRAYRTYTAWEPPGPVGIGDGTSSAFAGRGDTGRGDTGPGDTGPGEAGSPGRPGGPVMIVSPGREQIESAEDPACEAALCVVQACGHRLAESLRRAGLEVLLYEESEETDWAGAANRQRASVCLILRGLQAGSTIPPGVRIVTYDTRPGQLPHRLIGRIGDEVTGAARPDPSPAVAGTDEIKLVPWALVPVRHAARTDELANGLLESLALGLPEQLVARERWPHYSLEGLDMPGVVLYLGSLHTPPTVAVGDDALAYHLAEVLTIAIEEYQGSVSDTKEREWPR